MSKKRQTVLTPGQMKELIGAVTEGVPANLTPEQAQYWIGRKKKLAGELRRIFFGANTFSDVFSAWENFYKEIFQRKYDFSGIIVPEAEEIFFWAGCIPGEMENEEAFSGGKLQQKVWKSTSKKLDEVLDLSYGRDARKDSYIVRFRPNIEADEDLKNLSANAVEELKINTATLKERLLLGRFLFWKSGIILDQKTITLCAGSRGLDGGVPEVYWFEDDGEVFVAWYFPGGALDSLRSRQVVS